MERHRPFASGSGDLVSDEYTTAEGVSVGVRMPRAVIQHLAWSKGTHQPTLAPVTENVELEWAKRLGAAAHSADVSLEDGALARRFATSESLELLEKLLASDSAEADEAAWGPRVRLAGVVCGLTFCSRAAASTLAEALRSSRPGVRDAAAFAIGRAIRPGVHTPAMAILLSAVNDLLAAHSSPGWPRFAYSWAGALVCLEPKATIRRCREELERAAEDDRLWLVAAMARHRNAEALALLCRRLRSESSPRVGLRILVDVGAGVRERQRQASLGAALRDDSPWWRWQAIQELWRIRSGPARELLAATLSAEPDPLLRDLMLSAADALDLPATKARRLSIYG